MHNGMMEDDMNINPTMSEMIEIFKDAKEFGANYIAVKLKWMVSKSQKSSLMRKQISPQSLPITKIHIMRICHTNIQMELEL